MSEGHKPLTKTLSMELLASKFPLFRKKRSRDSGDDTQLTLLDAASKAPEPKRQKVAQPNAPQQAAKQAEFDKRERELDAELPEELRKFRPRGYKFNLPPKDRPIRIYADGVFDLFHLGHMKQLEQAKKAFPNVTLVCGIPLDAETHKRKGLTVLSDKDRCETLKHCRWVDEVIPNAPWFVTSDFLEKHNIDYVAHDDLPYALAESDDIYEPIKKQGKFLTTQRTEGILTSDIISKIIRDYDKYLMRNFARGATRKELNVSWLKKNELDFKKNIQDFRGYWTKNKNNLNNVSKDLYVEIREYLRNKKLDVQLLLSEDSRLPLENFAQKYMGNANKDLNFLKWISGDGANGLDDDEILPIKIPEVPQTPKKLLANGTIEVTPVKSPMKLTLTKTPLKTPLKTLTKATPVKATPIKTETPVKATSVKKDTSVKSTPVKATPVKPKTPRLSAKVTKLATKTPKKTPKKTA